MISISDIRKTNVCLNRNNKLYVQLLRDTIIYSRLPPKLLNINKVKSRLIKVMRYLLARSIIFQFWPLLSDQFIRKSLDIVSVNFITHLQPSSFKLIQLHII